METHLTEKTIFTMTPQELEDRLIEFADRIIKLVEVLPKTYAAKHLGGQLVRSGTSPALNYGEVRAAESNADFIHKMKVCLKELRESMVCLKLIDKQSWFPKERMKSILTENNELISIFVSSLKTASLKKI